MPLRSSGPVRRAFPATAGTLTLLTALALPLALPAAAAAATGGGTAAAGSDKEPAHPDQDWMGSTIAAHEGGDRAGGQDTDDQDTDEQGTSESSSLASVEGVDVSSHNGNVGWAALRQGGVRFAYVKATEGTTYKNPYFTQQYKGAYDAKIIHGAYHFALPDHSSGAAQAKYFAKQGGAWSKDGRTLPGALDLEYNPYGATCYGKSAAAMVDWIADFTKTYRAATKRDAVIYTSTNWWKQCTGNSKKFGKTNPLWVPRYGSSVGALPAGWSFQTIWQYTSSGKTVGDRDRFNGSLSRLQALANG
ncbi:lysozyme [Streptomyces sp. BBFR2]|uniref:lysozyme n=1 Tax=Streptomyces sp. BBFR2 TaxID=3372854 RepID=UPI0037DA7700